MQRNCSKYKHLAISSKCPVYIIQQAVGSDSGWMVPAGTQSEHFVYDSCTDLLIITLRLHCPRHSTASTAIPCKMNVPHHWSSYLTRYSSFDYMPSTIRRGLPADNGVVYIVGQLEGDLRNSILSTAFDQLTDRSTFIVRVADHRQSAIFLECSQSKVSRLVLQILPGFLPRRRLHPPYR